LNAFVDFERVEIFEKSSVTARVVSRERRDFKKIIYY